MRYRKFYYAETYGAVPAKPRYVGFLKNLWLNVKYWLGRRV